ncbi:unnamed protein product [Rodentolepis nana]|uniref:ANK_REP_REGION domain-containing protein n=1 Tax=Rodentolepis nana TaxID=102285 RepID=A0A0R3TL20_RODNA|nr:unnamed protein product [Rodentolepis nana]
MKSLSDCNDINVARNDGAVKRYVEEKEVLNKNAFNYSGAHFKWTKPNWQDYKVEHPIAVRHVKRLQELGLKDPWVSLRCTKGATAMHFV